MKDCKFIIFLKKSNCSHVGSPLIVRRVHRRCRCCRFCLLILLVEHADDQCALHDFCCKENWENFEKKISQKSQKIYEKCNITNLLRRPTDKRLFATFEFSHLADQPSTLFIKVPYNLIDFVYVLGLPHETCAGTKNQDRSHGTCEVCLHFGNFNCVRRSMLLQKTDSPLARLPRQK